MNALFKEYYTHENKKIQETSTCFSSTNITVFSETNSVLKNLKIE